jgi:choline dehydrogenase-like flavoprotein
MYDYVIVGAGSAGCVLAARLSEDPDVKVLLLEAGPPDSNENIHVPLGYLQLGSTEVDWDYRSAPESECDGRRIALPRGRTLGGSSSINAMVYIRGNPLDYDAWGVPGWSWADLLPYFIKAEDNERGASAFHGAGGPLPVSEERSHNRISYAFVEAGVQAGLARNGDFNDGDQDGVGMYQVTQRGGMRASTAVAYLRPAMERPNLEVLPYMHAQRLLFEGTRAVGVEAARLGELTEFRAEREVILAAGAYNSPQLLMLSGVGEAEHLTMREIEVVLEQPAVGENLSDHPATQLVWTTPEPESLLLALEPAALAEYEASQTGPFASNFAEAGGFARVGADAPAPDIQFHAVPLQIIDEGTRDPEAHGIWVSPCLLTEHVQRPDRQADHPQRLLHRGRRHAADDRRPAPSHADLRAGGAGPLLHGAVQRPRWRLRRCAARARGAHHVRDLPPRGHLPHGRRGGGCRRRAAARQRTAGPARGRRVGDAHGSARQHQRAHDRARRARRRSDPPRPRARGGGGRGEERRAGTARCGLARGRRARARRRPHRPRHVLRDHPRRRGRGNDRGARG